MAAKASDPWIRRLVPWAQVLSPLVIFSGLVVGAWMLGHYQSPEAREEHRSEAQQRDAELLSARQIADEVDLSPQDVVLRSARGVQRHPSTDLERRQLAAHAKRYLAFPKPTTYDRDKRVGEYLEIGEYLFACGEFDEAKRAVETARRLSTNTAEAIDGERLAAMIAWALGDTEAAQKHLRDVEEMVAQCSDSQAVKEVWMGRVLCTKAKIEAENDAEGQLSAATREQIERLISRYPSNPATLAIIEQLRAFAAKGDVAGDGGKYRGTGSANSSR